MTRRHCWTSFCSDRILFEFVHEQGWGIMHPPFFVSIGVPILNRLHSDQNRFKLLSVDPPRVPARLYNAAKRKRVLYLTDEAFDHVNTLAKARGSSPSEVIEQLVRLHIRATAIPSA